MSQSLHPLSVLAAAWMLGLLCSLGFGDGAGLVWLALAAFAAAALVGLRSALAAADDASARCGWGPLFALAGLTWAAGAAVPMRLDASLPLPPAGMARIVGVVEQCAALTDDQVSSVLRVVHGSRLEDGAEVAPGVLLAAGPAPLPAGATVRLIAKIVPRARFHNPTPHPLPPPHFELQGKAWVGDARAVELLEQSRWLGALEATRSLVRARLDQTLPARVSAIARALVLGDDRALDADDVAQVRSAGLLHVFAVSGLHVAILAGLLVELVEWTLRRTWLAARWHVRRIACGLGIPVVLLYAAFAGGSPSAWRAAITAAVGWAVVVCGRRPDAIAITSVSVLLWGGLDPSQLVRPAFLLSIVATAAILGGRFGSARDLSAWVREAFMLSARTSLATAPISLWFFGNAPLCGLLANVVLLPFGSILLVQLSAVHALSCTLTPWGPWTAPGFVLVSDAFVGACAQLARLWPALPWPVPDVAQGLACAFGASVILIARRPRTRWCAALLMLAALGALELRLRAYERPRAELRATFLDVGQGDAALIDFPDGRAMLIDAGGNPGGGADPGRAVILPLLQARRRARLDVAVLTHPHPDHYGGFAALLEAVPIGELWDSGQAEAEAELQATSAEAARLLALAHARGARLLGPAQLCDAPREFGGAKVRVLAPCPTHEPGYDPNDNSLVLRIEYGGRALLLAGDAEAHEEAGLVARGGELRADVLKVGHHGSRTSTSAAFLSAVAPRLAVVSAGAGNRFGHPHAEVLARLQQASARVLRLDVVGGSVVRTDGRRMQVETWSGEHFELAQTQRR